VIHRDIKPANILIDSKTGEPYVTDFGLSIREEDPTLGSGLAGSPAYMSPEQLRGEGHQLDGRSDLFSLGVVMYQLLTGKRPFEGSTKELIAREILDTEPPMGSTSNCWRISNSLRRWRRVTHAGPKE
jgi:serine/threonine protein kinase